MAYLVEHVVYLQKNFRQYTYIHKEYYIAPSQESIVTRRWDLITESRRRSGADTSSNVRRAESVTVQVWYQAAVVGKVSGWAGQCPENPAGNLEMNSPVDW